MTKQEILDKYTPCQCWPAKDGGKVYNTSCPQHSQDPETAMDEWAEFIGNKYFEWVRDNIVFDGAPRPYCKLTKDRHTGKELFTLFLQSIQQP